MFNSSAIDREALPVARDFKACSPRRELASDRAYNGTRENYGRHIRSLGGQDTSDNEF